MPAEPMTDQTDELAGRLEAVRQLLSAQDDRQTKLHDLLETIREQIRLGVKPEHRPEGLFKNIQDAVYAMRGRMPLLNDAAITSPLDEAAAALRALRAERDERAGWVTHWQTKCQSTAGRLAEARATIAKQAKEIEALREALETISVAFEQARYQPGDFPMLPVKVAGLFDVIARYARSLAQGETA